MEKQALHKGTNIAKKMNVVMSFLQNFLVNEQQTMEHTYLMSTIHYGVPLIAGKSMLNKSWNP